MVLTSSFVLERISPSDIILSFFLKEKESYFSYIRNYECNHFVNFIFFMKLTALFSSRYAYLKKLKSLSRPRVFDS